MFSDEGVPGERRIFPTFLPSSRRCQGQVTEAWVNVSVDVQVGRQRDGAVDHLPGARHGAPAEPGKPVAQASVDAFERDRLVLARIMPTG
jgi:hypothetical protein